jgi:hypothetical protein
MQNDFIKQRGCNMAVLFRGLLHIAFIAIGLHVFITWVCADRSFSAVLPTSHD